MADPAPPSEMALKLIGIRLDSIRETLHRTSSRDKEQNVSVPIVTSFNSVLDDLRKLAPELTSAIPPQLSTGGLSAMHFGISDIPYLDFEILILQVTKVLDLIR